ncbi:MAG TPA: hypothetical protein VFH51_08610, partial [Myxococcota bacterium]|nr:hypothetical protein [Myxococcota bacterium]
ATTLLHQAEGEQQAQRALDAAQAAMGSSHWSDAWNELQEVPRESSLSHQAGALIAQVKPALINERLTDCRTALKNEDWDEAELLLEEVDGLEPGRREVQDLRTVLEDGRKKHPGKASPGARPPHLRGRGDKDIRAAKPAPAPPVPAPSAKQATEDPKAIYADGVKALTAGQFGRAIELFNRCTAADKNFSMCYRAMGIAYSKSGNGPKAVRYYRLYLKVDPNAKDAPAVRQLLQQYDSAQGTGP